MKKISTFIFLLSLATISGQDISSNVSEIANLLQDVQAKKKVMKQSIEQTDPSVIKITVEETSTKGKVVTKTYEFSPFDIDANTIRATPNKDQIVVQLQVKSRQKMVKCINNNNTSYVNKLAVYATDIKNGRALEEKFKNLVPIAKKIIENRLKLSSYDDYKDWISNNIGDVILEKKQINQVFKIQPEYYGSVIFEQEVSTSKKTINNSYKFNLVSINPRSVEFDVVNELFNVVLAADDKLIKHSVDGTHKNFTNKIKIGFQKIEKARDFQKAIKELIGLSKEKFNKSLSKTTSISQGIKKINSLTKNIAVNDFSINQNLDESYVVNFSQAIEKNGKHTDAVYSFNFVDINKKNIKVDTDKHSFLLVLKTLSLNKYIKVIKNQEQGNYSNSIKIYTPDIESTLVVKATLEDIIGLFDAKNEIKNISSNKLELTTSIISKVKNVTINDKSFEQDFSIDDEGLLKFKKIEITKKASKEHLYECYLPDLNPSNVKFKTSGKNVRVELKTNKLEKIIKYYVEGEIKKYQNTISIEVSDIENARELVKLYTKLIELNQK